MGFRAWTTSVFRKQFKVIVSFEYNITFQERMQTGRHVGARARATGQSRVSSQIGTRRDPFDDVLHLRCFSSLSPKAANPPSTPSASSVPAVASSRHSTNRWNHKDASHRPNMRPSPALSSPLLAPKHSSSWTHERCMSSSSGHSQSRNTSATAAIAATVQENSSSAVEDHPRSVEGDSPPKSPTDQAPEKRQRLPSTRDASNEQKEDSSNLKQYTVMRALPAFEDDGLRIDDWNDNGPAAEAAWAEKKAAKIVNTQAHNFKPLHSLTWENLFDFHKQHSKSLRHHRLGNRPKLDESHTHQNVYDMTCLTPQQYRLNMWWNNHPQVVQFFSQQPQVPRLYRYPGKFHQYPGMGIPQTIARIEQLFGHGNHDPLAKMSLSLFDQTIWFLACHAQISYALDLVHRVRLNRGSIAHSTLRILLKSAVWSQHNSAFERNAKAMLQYGHDLGQDAWILLLQFAPTEESKRRVIHEMGVSGYLSSPFVDQSIVAEMIKFSLRSHLAKRRSLAEYVDALDALYGAKWVSSAAVGQMVDVLSSLGHFEDSLRLLYSLRSFYGYAPSDLDRDIMMQHHYIMKDMASAVRTVRRFGQLFATGVSEKCMGFLFSIAWNRLRTNCVRVIWKYTIFNHNSTTQLMRTIVHHSLTSALRCIHRWTFRGTSDLKWHQKAGFLACFRRFRDLGFLLDRESEPDMMQKVRYLMQDTVSNEEVTGRFEDELLHAWHRDLEFDHAGPRYTRRMGWLMRHISMSPKIPTLNKYTRDLYWQRRIPEQQHSIAEEASCKGSSTNGLYNSSIYKPTLSPTLPGSTEGAANHERLLTRRIPSVAALASPNRRLSKAQVLRARRAVKYKVQDRQKLWEAAWARRLRLDSKATSMRRRRTTFRRVARNTGSTKASDEASKLASEDWWLDGWEDMPEEIRPRE